MANNTCTRLANISNSLFRRARYCAFPTSMADRLDCYNQQKGENRRRGRHEYGRVVCSAVPLFISTVLPVSRALVPGLYRS